MATKRKMSKKDLINEYIGITSIIVIVILSAIGIYLYTKHEPQKTDPELENATIPTLSMHVAMN